MQLIQKLVRSAAALAGVMCFAGTGLAGIGALGEAYATPMPAPAVKAQPAKPVPANLYSGRWYEIARTPNSMQADCQGASITDFSGWAAGAFKAVQSCHKGSPSGPLKVMKVDGKVLTGSQNAKMQLGMLGGLLSQEYWILDHSDNNSWLIMATANQHYVWLMSRAPVLNAAEKAQAMARLQQMGFSLAHMAFPQQIAAR
jgi:apolipoprotein D and lipocalin family protein